MRVQSSLKTKQSTVSAGLLSGIILSPDAHTTHYVALYEIYRCKWTANIKMVPRAIAWIWLDSSGSGHTPATGSCEHGNFLTS